MTATKKTKSKSKTVKKPEALPEAERKDIAVTLCAGTERQLKVNAGAVGRNAYHSCVQGHTECKRHPPEEPKPTMLVIENGKQVGAYYAVEILGPAQLVYEERKHRYYDCGAYINGKKGSVFLATSAELRCT